MLKISIKTVFFLCLLFTLIFLGFGLYFTIGNDFVDLYNKYTKDNYYKEVFQQRNKTLAKFCSNFKPKARKNQTVDFAIFPEANLCYCK